MAQRSTELSKLAKSYGFELKRQTNHFIWQHAITRKVVTTAKTASDHRAIKNIEREFRRNSLVTA